MNSGLIYLKYPMKHLPFERILVIGSPGAGKTTLARHLADRFDYPLIHLDRLWWKPNWVMSTHEEFDHLLLSKLQHPRWIIDGNYRRTLALRMSYADAIIYLDFPVDVCLQGIRQRYQEYQGVARPDMPEGCFEQLDTEFVTYVTTFPTAVRPEIEATLVNTTKPIFRFTSHHDVQSWLTQLEEATSL